MVMCRADFLLLACFTIQVAAFSPIVSSHQSPTKLLSVRDKEEVIMTPTTEQIHVVVPEPASSQAEDEEELSTLDTRVLQSMIQEGKVDIDTEEDMRKLLERGAAPKNPDYSRREGETDSEFSSRVVQTMTDTKLWKAISAKADDWFDSAVIYIGNRAERDAKLLASIGLFTWERVKRDVARALPAAASSGATVGRVMKTTVRQLGSSTSFEEAQQAIKDSAVAPKVERNLDDIDLYDELNTPLDEIRSVTQSLKDILSGETVSSVSSSSRGLRSAAPAGDKTRTERQQRAYQKRKQTVLKREKEGVNVRQVAGGIVDTAWEVKRELGVEVNQPGYRTENIRNVIEAGAETTGRVIAAARDGGSMKNALFGAKEEEQILLLETNLDEIEVPNLPEFPDVPPEPTMVIEDVPLPEELMDEQASIISRLKSCIETPEETWLTPEVLATVVGTVDSRDLKEVVTAMICARDDLSVERKEAGTISELVNQLKKVKNTVDLVTKMAGNTIGAPVATKLTSIIYGSDPKDKIQPTLLALDEIQTAYRKDLEEAQLAQDVLDAAIAEREVAVAEWERIYNVRERMIEAAEAAAVLKAAEEMKAAAARAEVEASQAVESEAVATVVMDGVIDAVDVQVDRPSGQRMPPAAVIDTDGTQSTFAEVVSDSEFDDAIGVSFKSVEIADDDEEEEEENIAVIAVLRSLDFVFVIAEKVLLVGLPGVFNVAATASKRTDTASRGGLGRLGWTRIKYAEKGDKRY